MNKLYSYIESLILDFEYKTKYAPALYIIVSSFLLSTNTLISKMIIMSTSQMVLYRALIMLSMSLTAIMIQNTRVYTLSPADLYRIILRSFIGCFGAWLFFKAFQYLPLSEGTVLFRTQPLWTSLLAIFYLKTEKFSLRLLINLILCFLGIILISQPPIFQQLVYGRQVQNNEYHLIGVIMMVFVSILTAVVQILIKQLGKNVDQIIILLYFSYISALLAGVLLLYESVSTPGILQLGYLITMGVTSFFSQLLMNRAYIKGQLSQVSILGQSQVLFGFIFDVLIGIDIDAFGLVGTILIVSSLIAVVTQK